MNKKLIEAYKAEHLRTKGTTPTVTCHGGWFKINGRKGIGQMAFANALLDLRALPTVSDRTELVNGVPTLVKAHQHVVKNLLSGKDVVEAIDTPACCSVACESYWSM